MLNKKAQALIEFVLLLPIILIIVFSTIDVFNLLIKKEELTNQLDDQVTLVKNGKETFVELEEKLEEKDIDIKFKEEEKLLTIIAKKKIKWTSPITELILKNYTITIERVIPYE